MINGRIDSIVFYMRVTVDYSKDTCDAHITFSNRFHKRPRELNINSSVAIIILVHRYVTPFRDFYLAELTQFVFGILNRCIYT